MISTKWNPSVAFPPFSPFPVEGEATLRQLAEANFANAESVALTPIHPQCRVIGTTGIVWGHRSLAVTPKDGPLRATVNRVTFMFAKGEGQWREVAVHLSQLPSGN
jgi:ketosteroid isomerase-like protein